MKFKELFEAKKKSKKELKKEMDSLLDIVNNDNTRPDIMNILKRIKDIEDELESMK